MATLTSGGVAVNISARGNPQAPVVLKAKNNGPHSPASLMTRAPAGDGTGAFHEVEAGVTYDPVTDGTQYECRPQDTIRAGVTVFKVVRRHVTPRPVQARARSVRII